MKKTYHLYVGVGNKWVIVEVTQASWNWYVAEAEKQGTIHMKDRKDGTHDYFLDTPTDYDFFGFTREVKENV